MTISVGMLLKSGPFFQRLSEDLLEEMAEIGKTERCAAGATVFSEGDVPDRLYLILTGSVEVYKNLPNGQKAALATLGSGDFFGEMALIDGTPRSASVQALAPCEFFVI